MRTCKLKKQIFVLALFLSVCGVYSQQPNVTEEGNKAKAQELFTAGNYQEAMPLYAQLVSVYPNKSEYNYKFGVCTLFGDRTDRRRPIRYLNNALRSMGETPELHYYLGLAYYQNQEFANAMKYLNLYLAKLPPGDEKRPAILEHVNACLNGMNLEHKNLISEIVSTSEFQMDNFHRAYRADEFSGMLILKPDNFVSSREKNSGTNSFVYVSQPRGILYYAGYENKDATQKDIFRVSMDDKGNWGKPEKISDKLNSMFDEDYPVLANGGTTLYFCSKGHNSMGGYDIFKSNYNATENTFSEPENMGMGINSPFDDILFIPDKTGEFAYFSTNRDNLNNSINVYKIRISEGLHAEELMLAQNTSSDQINNQTEQNTSKSTVANKKEEKVIAQNTAPKVAPTVKAAALKQNRANLTQMADTAYMLVANTKGIIRSLTNKRDRANAIKSKKKEEAEELENQLNQHLSKIHEYAGEEDFEVALQKAVDLKKQVVQKRKSAEHANLIAWKIGKNIKIKNKELQIFKEDAGKVQSLSLTDDSDQTEKVYAELMSKYQIADTLKDFSAELLSVVQDAHTYSIPEKELAFAEDLRQGYYNNTLIADATSITKPKIDPDVPVVIVDNRKQTAVPVTPKVVVASQVEAISMASSENTEVIIDEDLLEINFTVDAVKPAKVVEQVLFAFSESEVNIEEVNLELKFDVDAIAAAPQIEMVAFNDYENITIDEEIEVIIEEDIYVAPIIEQIVFAETNIEVEDAEIELKFEVDAIDAAPMVEMIAFHEEESFQLDEDIEINIEEEINVTPLIEKVAFAETEIEIEDPELELKFEVDIIETASVVEMVAYNSQNEIIIDEDIEVNLEKDANVIPIIEPIEYVLADDEMNDPSLELRFDIDGIDALPVVEEVSYVSNDNLFEIDETIEVSYFIDRHQPAYNLIQPIRSEQYADLIDLEEENLEINVEKDLQEIKIAEVIQTIPLTFNEEMIELDDELDIDFSGDMITPVKLVEKVTPNLAISDMDEINVELELDFSTDAVDPYAQIEPVMANVQDTDLELMDEELEIGTNENVSETASIYPLIKPIYNEKLTSTDILITEPELEINDNIDLEDSYQLINPVEMAKVDMVDDFEEDLEINLNIDNTILEKEAIAAINLLNKRLETESVTNMPAIGVELFYLRETLEIAKDIETSRTDFEMLTLALTDPTDLSYEELLFAASIAQNPKEKLKIFYQAFIHIDRDWRAFNNAAISAINIHDLETAECFLYQASLISDNNGKILNNMGILSCYLNDFEKAKDLFITAGTCGVNSEYNLQVVQNIYNANSDTPSNFRQELGDHKYYEVLGDASELNDK